MNSYENPQLSYECDLTAERDRLREINAELLAALEELIGKIEVMNGCRPPDFDTADNECWPEFTTAAAAIAKAKGA